MLSLTFAMLNHKYLKHRWGQELQKTPSKIVPSKTFSSCYPKSRYDYKLPTRVYFYFYSTFCTEYFIAYKKMLMRSNDIKYPKQEFPCRKICMYLIFVYATFPLPFLYYIRIIAFLCFRKTCHTFLWSNNLES